MNSFPLFVLLFGISGGEIIVILLLVLILFGPKKIPEIARTIGKGINEIKKVQRDINAEIHRYSDEIENPAKEIREDIEGFKKGLTDQPARPETYPDPLGEDTGTPAEPTDENAEHKSEQDDDLPYPYNQIKEEASDEPPLEDDTKEERNKKNPEIGKDGA